MPLYTKIGDTGKTMLYGGSLTKKTDPRIHAYGTVDELSALIGVILAHSVSEELRSKLLKIQRMLYIVGADLATPLSYKGSSKRICSDDVSEIERWIDASEAKVSQLTHFILPGGSPVGALLHQARTVCRRAERWVFGVAEVDEVNKECLKYLNRLGDHFFAIARVVNKGEGVEEEKV